MEFVHDQSLRLLNLGRKPGEIAEEIALPPALASEWYLRGYYGSLRSTTPRRCISVISVGYDGNPANLDAHCHRKQTGGAP